MADAVVALPAIGRPSAPGAEMLTPSEMLAQAEALVASPAGTVQSAQGRTDSPPTDGMPTDPSLAAQRELVASLGKAVTDAVAGGSKEASADWLTRREVQAQRMAERVKARKLAAEEAEAAQKQTQKLKAQKKREQVRRRAEKNLREAEAATPAAALLSAVIGGPARGPGTTAHKKEQRLWGGNNGKGQVKGLLTRKLEAAKARQQATAVRMKEQAKRQAETRTRLVAALALAESATPGALPPLEEALKAGLREQLAEDSVVLRARELLNEAKLQAKAAAKAKARAAAEDAANNAAQAAAAAAATAAAEQAAREAAEAEARLVAAAQARAQLQSNAAVAAAAAGTPVRMLPRQLPPELDCRSPRVVAQLSVAAVDSTSGASAKAVPSIGLPPKSIVVEQRPSGASDPRSKPLWQATEAELLAELLRRQQAPQQMAPTVAAASIAVPLVGSSPDSSKLSGLPPGQGTTKPSPLAPRKVFAKEQADAEAAKAEKAAEIKRKEILEKKLLDKAARAEERKREVDAKQKAKVEQAQARHEAAQARVRARKEAEAEAVAVGTDDGSAAVEGGDARTQPAGDTHAADMRRQMLQARAAGAAAKAKLAQETAAAEQLQKEATSVDEDGVKWRMRPDGTKVKIVRKACPEGEELRSAVQEMATEAGWSEHKLISRLSGFQGDEQGYRSIWLLLRKEQKTKAKLDKLKAVQTTAELETPDATEQVRSEVDADLQATNELQKLDVSTDGAPCTSLSTRQDPAEDNSQNTSDGDDGCRDTGATVDDSDSGAAERKPWQKGRKALIPKPWKKKNKKKAKQRTAAPDANACDDADNG
jgi:hypothetical protein